METYRKIDEYSLEVARTVAVEPTKSVYEKTFLEKQIVTITEDRDSYVALRNIEIVECQAFLAKMSELNIIKKEVLPIIK